MFRLPFLSSRTDELERRLKQLEAERAAVMARFEASRSVGLVMNAGGIQLEQQPEASNCVKCGRVCAPDAELCVVCADEWLEQQPIDLDRDDEPCDDDMLACPKCNALNKRCATRCRGCREVTR